MRCFEDVAKLLQFNVIVNLIHLGYIWYFPKIIKGTVKGQGSLTYYPYPYPQVPLPITLKGYPYPCYCLGIVHSNKFFFSFKYPISYKINVLNGFHITILTTTTKDLFLMITTSQYIETE